MCPQQYCHKDLEFMSQTRPPRAPPQCPGKGTWLLWTLMVGDAVDERWLEPSPRLASLMHFLSNARHSWAAARACSSWQLDRGLFIPGGNPQPCAWAHAHGGRSPSPMPELTLILREGESPQSSAIVSETWSMLTQWVSA